jgi:hypothetical protein
MKYVVDWSVMLQRWRGHFCLSPSGNLIMQNIFGCHALARPQSASFAMNCSGGREHVLAHRHEAARPKTCPRPRRTLRRIRANCRGRGHGTPAFCGAGVPACFFKSAGETPAPQRSNAGETPAPQRSKAGETPAPQTRTRASGYTCPCHPISMVIGERTTA